MSARAHTDTLGRKTGSKHPARFTTIWLFSKPNIIDNRIHNISHLIRIFHVKCYINASMLCGCDRSRIDAIYQNLIQTHCIPIPIDISTSCESTFNSAFSIVIDAKTSNRSASPVNRIVPCICSRIFGRNKIHDE